MANSTKTEIRKTDFLKLGTTTGDICRAPAGALQISGRSR